VPLWDRSVLGAYALYYMHLYGLSNTHLLLSFMQLSCVSAVTQASTRTVTDAWVWLFGEIHFHRVHLFYATFAVGSERITMAI